MSRILHGISNDVTMTPNQERYANAILNGMVDEYVGLPVDQRVYFRFTGAFLKFENQYCRAIAIPQLTMEASSIYRYFFEHQDQVNLFLGWKRLLAPAEHHFESIVALPIWDMEKSLFNFLCMRLEQFPYVPPVILTREMQCLFLEERSIGFVAQDGDVKSTLLLDETIPEDSPSLVEVTLSAFVNGLTSKDDIRSLLNVQGFDCPKVQEFKINIVKDGIDHGMVNPEITSKIMPSGNQCADAALYNDGYRNHLNRVAMLSAVGVKNHVRMSPLKRVRTGYRAWGVDRKNFYTGHNMIRFVSVYPSMINGKIVFSKPRVLEVSRGSPEVLHQDRLFPLIILRTNYGTGYNIYPIMEVWCVNHTYDPPDIFFKFPDAIKDILTYLINLMSGRLKYQFPLPEDVMKIVKVHLSDRDHINLGLTCRTLYATVGVYVADVRYRCASFSNIEAKYISQFEPPPPIMFTGVSTNSIFSWRNLAVFFAGKNPLNRPELQFYRVSGETFRPYDGHRTVDLTLDFGLHADGPDDPDNPQIVRRVSKRNRYQFKEISMNPNATTNDSYFVGLPRTANRGTQILLPRGSSIPVTEIRRKDIDHDYDIANYPEDPPGSDIVRFRSPMTLDTIEQTEWTFSKRKKKKFS